MALCLTLRKGVLMKVLKGNRIIIIQEEEYPRYQVQGYIKLSEQIKEVGEEKQKIKQGK